MFFSIDETTRLTGLKIDRLRYLAKLGAVVPYKIAPDGYVRKLTRYSWDQILELRAIASLPQSTSVKKIKALRSFLESHRGDHRLLFSSILAVGEDQFCLISNPDNIGKVLAGYLENGDGQSSLHFVLIPALGKIPAE